MIQRDDHAVVPPLSAHPAFDLQPRREATELPLLG
jgi:hypothetical protein